MHIHSLLMSKYSVPILIQSTVTLPHNTIVWMVLLKFFSVCLQSLVTSLNPNTTEKNPQIYLSSICADRINSPRSTLSPPHMLNIFSLHNLFIQSNLLIKRGIFFTWSNIYRYFYTWIVYIYILATDRYLGRCTFYDEGIFFSFVRDSRMATWEKKQWMHYHTAYTVRVLEEPASWPQSSACMVRLSPFFISFFSSPLFLSF